jgi:glycosyltransferase involved in cell wall biosynthesis
VKPIAAFIFNLVQDVAVLRPLVTMAARDFGMQPLFLISSKFGRRDPDGIWRDEIDGMILAFDAQVRMFQTAWDAAQGLSGQGLLFAASESHLPNHSAVHDIFRICPATYLKVTLQHGFECVGFLHSADHVRAHGETASFGADYVCAWSEASVRAMAPSQRSKLVVTGPTSVLQLADLATAPPTSDAGLVCENLHSVRFRGPGERAREFVQAFSDFCSRMGASKVALRPHPGGQYVLKNNIDIPGNAYIENTPVYRLDLRQFQYGISAPSSVLIDMLLAEIPTAVWRDGDGGIDKDNYAGLETVGTPQEWVEFAQAAVADPAPYLERQRLFLERTGMVLDPAEVFSRFAELFDAALRRRMRPVGSVVERHRLQFVASSRLPTLQLSFEKPLAGPAARGEVFSDLITEREVKEFESAMGGDLGAQIFRRLDETQPTALIFCRYSGPYWQPMVEWAKSREVPILYHIDDDLLAIPRDIGDRKHAFHNAPERLDTVRSLISSADLVYCSTERLKNRLLEYYPQLPVVAGKVYCSGTVLRRPVSKEEVVVGYMASADHAHNLELVLPAIERLLDENVNVRFELFGSIPIPPELHRFGNRVSTAPPVADYGRFLEEFAAREWDVGICPLVPIHFNLMKANTKWVEYSSAGVSVVASRGTVYDDCCSDGCGILAAGADEWFEALRRLVNNAELRCAQVERAQAKLVSEYSLERLREQLFAVMASAKGRANQLKRSENPVKV